MGVQRQTWAVYSGNPGEIRDYEDVWVAWPSGLWLFYDDIQHDDD
jgi:hypothetical protein